MHRTHIRTIYPKVLCNRLFLGDLLSNDISLVLLLQFHSVPFIVSLVTPAVTVRPRMDAGFLCDKAALVGDRIKETCWFVLQKRRASPAPLPSSLFVNVFVLFMRLHSATELAQQVYGFTGQFNLLLHLRVSVLQMVNFDHGRLHIFESRMMNQLPVFVR